MTHPELIARLQAAAKKLGSQAELARRLKVSEAYLSDVLNSRKDPGEKILQPLGLERVITYERRKE
jgi:transcriptional regulator with XRE-family HTH domain